MRLVFQLPLMSTPGLCLHRASAGGTLRGFSGWTMHLLGVGGYLAVPPLPASPGTVFMVLLQNRNYCRST